MVPYLHRVQYYETDKMGIVHHANYIRWMEEARMDFLRQIGWEYERLESQGVVVPVTAVNCRYRKSTAFAEEIAILVSVAVFAGVRLTLRYVMTNKAGETVLEGETQHCFLDGQGRFLRLKTQQPDLYEALCALAQLTQTGEA